MVSQDIEFNQKGWFVPDSIEFSPNNPSIFLSESEGLI